MAISKLKGFIQKFRGTSLMDALFVGGKEIPTLCTFSIAQASTQYYSAVTVYVCNKEGVPVNKTCVVDIWISDAATGIGVVATGPATSVTVTVGASLGSLTANKAFRVVTDATGKATIQLADDATPVLLYVAASIPGSGQVSVSRKTVAGDYKP